MPPPRLPFLMVLLLLAAGCRGGGPPAAGTSGTRLAVAASEDMGRYVTDAAGRALYASSADAKNSSNCYDACATAWTPVPGTNPPLESTEPAIQPELLGSTTRTDGTRQLTYAGLPLYYRSGGEAAALQRSVNDQWGTWSLLFPHGERMVP